MENNTTGMHCIALNLNHLGFEENTVSILMNSWREGTKQQYKPFINQWFQYAEDKGLCNRYNPPTPEALEFLTKLFNSGASYNKINTAKSALSALFMDNSNVSFGKFPVVKRFMKGIYESRPVFSKILLCLGCIYCV